MRDGVSVLLADGCAFKKMLYVLLKLRSRPASAFVSDQLPAALIAKQFVNAKRQANVGSEHVLDKCLIGEFDLNPIGNQDTDCMKVILGSNIVGRPLFGVSSFHSPCIPCPKRLPQPLHNRRW
jgi:hypothetical protein